MRILMHTFDTARSTIAFRAHIYDIRALITAGSRYALSCVRRHHSHQSLFVNQLSRRRKNERRALAQVATAPAAAIS